MTPQAHLPATSARLDVTRPFTRAEALASGISLRSLGGSYPRIFRGIFIAAGRETDLLVRAGAALRIAPPGSVVAHHTAATLWGLWLPDDPRVHVAVPAGGRRATRPGLVTHRLRPSATNHRVHGLPTTAPLECLLSLARELSLVDTVALIDSAYAADLLTPTAVHEFAHGLDIPGAGALRRAAALSRPGSRSRRESALRLLFHFGGYPEPALNLPLRTSGRRLFLDLAFERWRVAAEYDGRQHATDHHQYAHDVRRREDIAVSGWALIVAVDRDLSVEPGAFLDRFDEVVRRSGHRPPPRRTDWRHHFGGRPPLGGLPRDPWAEHDLSQRG